MDFRYIKATKFQLYLGSDILPSAGSIGLVMGDPTSTAGSWSSAMARQGNSSFGNAGAFKGYRQYVNRSLGDSGFIFHLPEPGVYLKSSYNYPIWLSVQLFLDIPCLRLPISSPILYQLSNYLHIPSQTTYLYRTSISANTISII